MDSVIFSTILHSDEKYAEHAKQGIGCDLGPICKTKIWQVYEILLDAISAVIDKEIKSDIRKVALSELEGEMELMVKYAYRLTVRENNWETALLV